MNHPSSHSLPLKYDVSLYPFNTLKIPAQAKIYLPVTSVSVLHELFKQKTLMALPRFILGGGSNIVLTEPVPELILHVSLKGIHIVEENNEFTYVRAAAGEQWHHLVCWTLAHHLYGLENLSLIPGSVGAAPVQNIGAYGAELQQFFYSLTAWDSHTNKIITLDKIACQFGYRDSIFKQSLQNRMVILDVTLALPKHWKPNVHYAELNKIFSAENTPPTAQHISDTIINIRQKKLPDPAVIGNVGSFFKNPIVSAEQYASLRIRFPDLISYTQPDGRHKLAAGWLIEQCGWKGKTLGPAGVYEQQALVLINLGQADGDDILNLAHAIQKDVAARFNIELEPEPIFVGGHKQQKRVTSRNL